MCLRAKDSKISSPATRLVEASLLRRWTVLARLDPRSKKEYQSLSDAGYSTQAVLEQSELQLPEVCLLAQSE